MPSITSPIRRAAVLGAGTMGAQIAAHLANAGVPVLLLDLDTATAAAGLKRAQGLKPDPFFTADAARLVTVGGFDSDVAALSTCDWVVEAIVEQIEAKRALLDRIEPHLGPGTIVSSNTSGIPLGAIAEGRSEAFRRRWLGTHFFNPPRYLRLVEVIPLPDTDPAVTARLSRFLDVRLGKGVVPAKDTPNFIANHIGLYGLFRILHQWESGQFGIEEIDALTGPAMGRPKSATFRTIDITGLDVLAHVATNFASRTSDPALREVFALPPRVRGMLERGWIGEKAGQGFYKRVKGRGGESEILVLDPETWEYGPRREPALPALARIREQGGGLGARLKALLLSDSREGAFARDTLGDTLIYTARVADDIAHSIHDVDRAMRWGFGWDLGPFEIVDAVGIQALAKACAADLPPLFAAAVEAGRDTVREGGLPAQAPGLQLLRESRAAAPPVAGNSAASVLDIGDGVFALELHSKMNAIGGDTLAMLHRAVDEAEQRGVGLVVGTDATNFSAGANLMLLLLEAQEGNWDDIDLTIRGFQRAVLRLRDAAVPVVVATGGLTLGGSCEMALHADKVQAAAETYMGLVEVGVGLLPAGCGTKEMLWQAMQRRPDKQADPLPFVQQVFETIGFGKVSTSAAHARQLRYLSDRDDISMNRERLLADAKAAVLGGAPGYRPSPAPDRIPVGGDTVRAALDLGVYLAWRAGRLSDHDVTIGKAIAKVLAGGDLPHATHVSEAHLLDLEREAFLRLTGEPKTLARIAHTLKTGKPLRN
jgi:3-hydroxyacyl-CoA dehydrogenase